MQARLYWDFCFSPREWKQFSRYPCSLSEGAGSFINEVRVGADCRLGWWGGSGDSKCRDQAWYPVLAPSTSEVVVGFPSFCILLFVICPSCCVVQLFSVPFSFFVFCYSRTQKDHFVESFFKKKKYYKWRFSFATCPWMFTSALFIKVPKWK